MPWSTREVAELAGTTVNTVRHYHRVGLLESPLRMSNGYKQYQAVHLIRLLQIRRMRDLGVPIERIEQVGLSGEAAADALRVIDADISASIVRLQNARAEVRAILSGSSVAGIPAGFENVASKLSKPEQSLMLVYSQIYDDEAMADLRQMLEDEPDHASEEFSSLDSDADEVVRQRMAEEFAPALAQHYADYPWLSDPTGHFSKPLGVSQRALGETVKSLLNPAQLDVLVRARELARGLGDD